MCIYDHVGKIMEYVTYTIFAGSTAMIGFFDAHAAGIMAICAVLTAITSMYFKYKANVFFRKRDKRECKECINGGKADE